MSRGVDQRKVLVVQRRMTHYRVPFFEALKNALSTHDIQLVLAYGEPTSEEATKRDAADIEWGYRLPTKYALGGRICWQPFDHLLPSVTAVVLTPENKLLNNLPTQFFNDQLRVILWGHGANLQGNPNSLRERFKRRVARKADWWLAYTDMSLPHIQRSGFPPDRVTVLNNAVDTVELSRQFDSISGDDVAEARTRYKLKGNHIGLFIGSMYPDKRISFLLQSAQKIRQQVEDFELLLFGSGPQAADVEAFCAKNTWAHYGGVVKGRDKAAALAASTVMLNPGLVGLGILDSFVCGVPTVTTDCGLHSPEIAYLQNGTNGLMVEDDLNRYVDATVALLRDSLAVATLQQGCLASAKLYTINNMAANFAEGVRHCLEAPRWR